MRLSLGLEVLAAYMKAIEAAFNTEMDMTFGTRPESFVRVFKDPLI